MENKYLKLAFDYLDKTDLNALPLGKHIIDEGNVWVNIIEADLRPACNALLEVHDKFLDIHVPIDGKESYAVKPRSECILPKGCIDKENDILFFDDEICNIITKEAGESTIFDTDTAHAPLIGEGKLKKAILKVRKS